MLLGSGMEYLLAKDWGADNIWANTRLNGRTKYPIRSSQFVVYNELGNLRGY